ncbi:ketose-bisphosphate aldolase [Enterococcus sp. LJL90]
MLINMKEMLTIAKENSFAVGAFNISDANQFKAVVEAAEENNAPAIIAVHPDELSFITNDFCAYIIKRIGNSKNPFVLHLDHGGSVEDVMQAVSCGFTSVMIDGSLLEYEQNVEITKRVVELVKPLSISVEGELGTIGNTGNSIEGGVSEIVYTRPIDAEDFVERTGIDSLAVAIGTAHGIYPKDFVPELQIDLLKEIVEKVDIPLVLHGGSSNKDEEISKAVAAGVQKINISSDLKVAYINKCKEVLSEQEIWEPNQIFPPCIEAAKALVVEKMELFRSIGRAKFY